MNLPNKLTMLRVLMIPVFVVLYLAQSFFWALVVFVLAAITDALDGMLARKYKLVTNFGALMDPLADKLLVMAAMLCFVADALVFAPLVIIILSREFLVTSIRLVAAGKGVVIAADTWGKLKTVFQMIWIIYGLLIIWLGRFLRAVAISRIDHPEWYSVPPFSEELALLTRAIGVGWLIFSVLTWVVVALTVLSGINYIVRNRRLINDA